MEAIPELIAVSVLVRIMLQLGADLLWQASWCLKNDSEILLRGRFIN